MSFLSKTLGGLSRAYYTRQFLFGLIFFISIVAISYNGYNYTGNTSILVKNVILGLICLLLYPYSRFVYESIIEYILGDNVFFVNVPLMLVTKLITMAICFIFSIFIAPIGLIYLYFYHSKQEKLQNQNEQ
ncbi:hypothetical protein [Haemophilus influenzae]|uniref:Uncharacterized protein n=1 Tax=Haemophilus influenzae TaxID=727 RepID=A0AB37B4Y8_HAEIF|nr:hypothetical protein [Haemophilus influenzae]PRJ25403.1 hypothetical protein BV056_01364 [Haemophilus influenzae]PRM83037.1 hypothetical protein BV055_00912 [Haemophilus influenzae]